VCVNFCQETTRRQHPCLEKEAELGLGKKVSLQPRCEGMGTSVSSQLSLSCRSLLAHPQINASRTQCALHPILPTSFARKVSSLSCPKIIPPTPENRNVRSARIRSGNRGPTKSPISTSAFPGHHVEANLVRPVAAREPAGDRTYQMQVRAPPRLSQG
jgi:hypothetical protein